MPNIGQCVRIFLSNIYFAQFSPARVPVHMSWWKLRAAAAVKDFHIFTAGVYSPFLVHTPIRKHVPVIKYRCNRLPQEDRHGVLRRVTLSHGGVLLADII